ncbi:MAG: molybdopterin molybdotransferase MoeA [Hyphomicrobiaceae bacterium]
MLQVSEALARVLANAVPVETEIVCLLDADGRVLAKALTARRSQPPFNVSAMDGFAVVRNDVLSPPVVLNVIGVSAAGHGYHQPLAPGDAVRIFTGAPLPPNADAIVIQENTRSVGQQVEVLEGLPNPGHVRAAGMDFRTGETLLAAGRRLTARDVSLAAAMGYASLEVRRRPRVDIIATGDEIVLPGDPIGVDQIVCSNPFGVAGIVQRAGGSPYFRGIAPDEHSALAEMCKCAIGADLLITIGGASVGDHDIVAPVLKSMGMTLDFWKIAMRPGKPLMCGQIGSTLVIGLPGNPVSSLICSHVFIRPLIHALLNVSPGEPDLEMATAAVALDPNGSRQHYMRAIATRTGEGEVLVTPVASQDSSLLRALAASNALIVRPPNAPPVTKGSQVPITRIDF